MKTKLFSIILLFFSLSIFAEVPQAISYQAVARKTSGEIIANKKVSIRVSILQGTETGTSVYSEFHNPTTNQQGVITLQIGKGNTPTGAFSNINWANGPYFVKMEMDTNGGNQYVTVGTSQMLSVPYALYAETAGKVELNDYIVSVDDETTEEILFNQELSIEKESFGKGDYFSANVVYLDSKDQEVDCNLTGLPSNIIFKKTVSKSTNYGRHFNFELTSEIDHSTNASYNCKMVFTNKSGITKEFPFVFKIEKTQ